MVSTTTIVLIIVPIVVLSLFAAAFVIVYFAFFRKSSSSFPLPAVQGVPTEFATSNGMVPNGSNSINIYSSSGSFIGCTAALNQNAIGYQVINNSGITQSCFLNSIYYNSTTCGGDVTNLALFVINPFSTVNWYDKSSGKDNTGALVYPTFYLNCIIAFLPATGPGQATFYPGGTSDINISKQYYQITFNNDGTSSGKAVNA